MGVENLMSFVKNSTSQTDLSQIDIRNKTVAIDASHWIYRAAYACPEKLYYRNQMHHAHAIINNYIANQVKILKQYNVKLIFIFDGMRLPAKKQTNQDRSEKKEQARKLVAEFLAAGNDQEARKHMVRCLDIRFDIVKAVIDYCKKNKFEYIVAPYEADAQLAFLDKNGICDFIVTEDSDLILYGCRKIVYKLNAEGKCMLYDKSKLHKCLGPRGDEVGFDKFRRICILSGCDYIKNIPSIGLQSAKKFFLMTRQDNLSLLLPKLPVYLKAPRLAGKVTRQYIEDFIKSEEVFKHHIVYDPRNERLCPLEAYPNGKNWDDFPRAGKLFHHTMAKELAKGNIDLDNINENDLDTDSEYEDDKTDDDSQINDQKKNIIEKHENENQNDIEVTRDICGDEQVVC